MRRPIRHVFVCTNERPSAGKPSCGARGAGELFAALQREVGARPALWGVIAITPCGCLGPCFDGPNVAIYPDGIFYRGVAAADAPELVERHLAGGTPVERLRYPFDEEEGDPP